MTPPSHSTPHPPTQPSLGPGNDSVAIARHAATRRAADRSATARKRRAAAKLTDPLQLLSLVVCGTRGNGKFVCPLCTSTFGRRCELKRHVGEVHTIDGARRFQCKYPACDKSFTRKDALAKHEIVKHLGKRRFVCPVCSEKFTSRYDLSRHNIRVHSNVKKRFTCEFCAAGFSQKSQLTMHKGRVHTTPKTPLPPQSPKTIRCSSMDELAAAAAAVAAKEAAEAASQSMNGPPSHQREADGTPPPPATYPTNKEEAAAAALAADALLEAAAVMQPALLEINQSHTSHHQASR